MKDRNGMSGTILEDIHAQLDVAKRVENSSARPFVTLAYAQSLDGSIAGEDRRPLSLSSSASLTLTHQLRAAHDVILVGIGTVLADDPHLNVRLVDGEDPQPVVVDSRLRLPDTSRLLNSDKRPWLVTTEHFTTDREESLKNKGVDVLRTPPLPNGWVDLEALLQDLADKGISHVLVEGGARVLTSFLRACLVDYVVLTVAPLFVGGIPALYGQELLPFPRLKTWRSERFGEDLVLSGSLSCKT